MRAQSAVFPRLAIGTSLILVCAIAAFAQTPLAPATVDQLKSQYKTVRLAEDANGLAVIEPGTVLVLRKGGILGVPPTSAVLCPAKFQDSELHAPGGFCAAMVKQSSRYFQAGEKVYATKVDINLKKGQISFLLVACDACNGADPPSFYKSEVVFVFAKGYLETATAAQLQETIGQVLRPDVAATAQPASQAGPPAGTVGAGSPAGAAAKPEAEPLPVIAAPAPPPDQPAPTIEVGQTVDQVVAALGQPQRIAKAGTKQIYFYKDLKVTFNNGKVSDVE